MAYFYKGFRIIGRSDGTFAVISPAIGNKLVKLTKSRIEAKIWIEQVDSKIQLIQANQAIEKILGK